jgi:hypothetical protein
MGMTETFTIKVLLISQLSDVKLLDSGLQYSHPTIVQVFVDLFQHAFQCQSTVTAPIFRTDTGLT